MSDTLKQCKECKALLPRVDFAAHYRTKDKLMTICRRCHGSKAAESQRRNRILRISEDLELPVEICCKLTLEVRRCSKCESWKHLSEFFKNAGLCKSCSHDYVKSWRLANPEKYQAIDYKASLKKKRTTTENFSKRLEEQNGLCAICEKVETSSSRSRLSVDHCHDTGKIRGLLCLRCNAMLGQFNDDARLLRKAAKYLEES